MIRKCYYCNNIYFIISDPSINYVYFKNCCPACGNENTQEFPIWIIEQEIEYYYIEKSQGKEYKSMADIGHLKKILEFANMYEILRKLGE
jgi:hypothetical protein